MQESAVKIPAAARLATAMHAAAFNVEQSHSHWHPAIQHEAGRYSGDSENRTVFNMSVPLVARGFAHFQGRAACSSR